MLKQEAKEFWDAPDFRRQQELIAGSVAWDTSVQNAALHRTWIETPMIREWLTKERLKTPVVAEIGCGVGRLLKEFLNDYECKGYDISEHMLSKAVEYLGDTPNNYRLLPIAEGGKLFCSPNSVDFFYSFLVFQHIQTKREIRDYMREIERHLRPEGFFRVQTLKGLPQPEDKFGGFHGRFYPSLAEFSIDILSMTENMTLVENQEGLGHPEWLWLTLRKKR